MPPGEEDLLSQLEPDIQRMAKCWALDDPAAWEDLAQEARIGIIQELRKNPNSPRSHLFGAPSAQSWTIADGGIQ